MSNKACLQVKQILQASSRYYRALASSHLSSEALTLTAAIVADLCHVFERECESLPL